MILAYVTLCDNFVLTITSLGANAQSNNVGAVVEASILGKHVSMPETNLNIGMDLWNASVGGAGVAKVRQNPYGASLEHMIGSEDVMPEQWIQV
jgi:plant G-box-binding factor